MEFQVLSYNISLNKQMVLEIDAPEGDKKKTQMAFVGEWEIVCHGKMRPVATRNNSPSLVLSRGSQYLSSFIPALRSPPFL